MAEFVLEITAQTNKATNDLAALRANLDDLAKSARNLQLQFFQLGTAVAGASKEMKDKGKLFGESLRTVIAQFSSLKPATIEKATNAGEAIKNLANSLVLEGSGKGNNLVKRSENYSAFATALTETAKAMEAIPTLAANAKQPFKDFINSFADTDVDSLKNVREIATAVKDAGFSFSLLSRGNMPENLASTTAALREMSEAAKGMSSVGDKVGDFARGLQKLPGAVTAMSRFTQNNDYSSRVANMGKALKDISDAAGGVKPEVARSIANLGSGLSQLSKAATDTEMPNKLQRLGEGVKNFATMAVSSDLLNLQGTASALASFTKSFGAIATKIGDGAGEKLVQLATDISKALLMLSNIGSSINFESIASEMGALKNILKPIREIFAAGESLEFAQASATGTADAMRTLVSAFDGISVDDNLSAVGGFARQIGYFVNGLKGISTSDIRAKGDAIEGFFLQMNAVFSGKDMSGMENIAPSLLAFGKALQGIGRKTLGKDFAEAGRVISEFVTKLSSLPDSTVAKFEKIANACSKAGESIKHLNSAEKALEKSKKGSSGDSFAISLGQLKGVTSKVAAAWAIVKKVIEGVKRVIVGVVSEAMKLWKAAGKIASAFGKITKPLMNFLTGGTFKKSGLAKFLSKVGNIIKYRLIRSGLRAISNAAKEGLENLYQYSVLLNNMDSAKAMGGLNELATTALYLKNTLGAALMPIINALMPLINALAEAFVRVANAVNAFVSALMGLGTFTAAKRYAKSFGDELGGAADKAKELEKTILGFDEINRLNDNKDTAGGGGADALDYSEMFEPREIPEWIKEIAKLFKQGKWKEVGDIITKKLTEAMNGVKWGEIGANFGKKFATVLGVLATILHEFPWDELGSNLATAFNRFLNSMNNESGFYNLGQLIMARFMILIETIGSFIANLDPLALAEGFSQFAIGVVDAIIETLSETPWQSIVDNIVEFITNIRWGDVLDKMTEMLKMLDPVKIIEAFFSVLSAVPWADIITTITEWLRGIDWPKLEQDIYDFITSDDFLETVQAFVDAIGEISEHFSEVTDKIAEALGTAIESVNWGGFIQGIIDAAISAWTFKFNIYAAGALHYDPSVGNGLTIEDYAFASGGFPDAGSVFIAGEAGPEFVGNIGGQTGVMNTDQMAQSVASGNARVETLLVELIRAVNNKDFDVSLDGKSLSDQMRKYDRQNARAYG